MRNMSFPITNASRKCLLCDKPYLASSRTQKYCGAGCAKKVQDARTAQKAETLKIFKKQERLTRLSKILNKPLGNA